MLEGQLMTHIPKLTGWLKTYPIFIDTNPTGDIDIIAYDPYAAEGAIMLQNTGAVFTASFPDIVSEMVMHAEVEYMLFARYNVKDVYWRTMASEYLTNMCEWCAKQKAYGKQPIFGDYETESEMIEIKGGSPFNIIEGQPLLSDFMWQMKLTYQYVLEGASDI
jgi:hypothetical protein